MGNQLPATASRHTRTTAPANVDIDDDDSTTASDDGAVVLLLPRDVLFEILLRVPAARLCRLRAVCRRWRALLSDPQFVAAHGARHSPRGHQLFAVAARGFFAEEADVELLDPSSGRVVRRLPSRAGPSSALLAHGGLVCAVGNDRRLRALDPLTGAVSLLPDPGRSTFAASSFVLGRAAGAAGEYKLLSVTRTPTVFVWPSDSIQFCKVLTLGADGGGGAAGVWREAPMPPTAVRTGHPWVQAAVAAGVVYVLARGRLEAPESDWIAAFDLEAEQWRPELIRGPPRRDRPGKVTSLGVMDGRLVAVTESTGGTSALTFWVLKADEGGTAGGPCCWQWKCTVPASSSHRVWVLDGGRVAFMVSLRGIKGGQRDHDERGYSRVLLVYDSTTGRYDEVARLPESSDGLYSGNLLSFGS